MRGTRQQANAEPIRRPRKQNRRARRKRAGARERRGVADANASESIRSPEPHVAIPAMLSDLCGRPDRHATRPRDASLTDMKGSDPPPVHGRNVLTAAWVSSNWRWRVLGKMDALWRSGRSVHRENRALVAAMPWKDSGCGRRGRGARNRSIPWGEGDACWLTVAGFRYSCGAAARRDGLRTERLAVAAPDEPPGIGARGLRSTAFFGPPPFPAPPEPPLAHARTAQALRPPRRPGPLPPSVGRRPPLARRAAHGRGAGARARVLDRDPAAERHRRAPPRPRPQQHPPGRARPHAADAGPPPRLAHLAADSGATRSANPP